MKITTTKKTTQEVELKVPAYFKKEKNSLREYYAILNEDDVINLFIVKPYSLLKRAGYSDFSDEIENIISNESYARISEDEFFQIYENFLESQSMKPKLINNG